MATEWIKGVFVRADGVYLHSKSNNDDCPYRIWRCDSLSDIYRQEGQPGLDREMVRMFCEYAEIRGSHPSVERYRYSLMARGHFSVGFVEKLNAEYAKLTPEDIATLRFPEARQTEKAKEYRAFERVEENKYYTTLAGCAGKVTNRKPPPRDTGAR